CPQSAAHVSITLKFREGIWALSCEQVPGLYLCHASLDLVMADFLPAWRKLHELDGSRWNGPVPPQAPAQSAAQEGVVEPQRCPECGHGNRLNGRLIHAFGC